MTAKQKLDAIVAALQANIPAALSSAGLDDFAFYGIGTPREAERSEMLVYLNFENDTTSEYRVSFIIQCQLFGSIQENEYHSAMFPVIKQYITSKLLDVQTRDAINSDIWPNDQQTSTSYVFYEIEFFTELDDCE